MRITIFGQTAVCSVSATYGPTQMGRLYKCVLLILVLMAMLHSTSGKKKGSSKTTFSKTPSSSSYDPSQGTKTQPKSPSQPSSPGAGSNPGRKPGTGGMNPAGGGRYPGAGAYPVRTGENWEGFPGVGGGYPNWNPNNNILSPRYGGAFAGGFGTGGSPFSRSVQSMGYTPSVKSKGFGKQAMLAAGGGVLKGQALGYGVGRFPRPDFQFNSPQEEYYYNQYMYQRHKTGSGGNYILNLPPYAQSYEQYMNTCMKREDLLKEQDTFNSKGQSSIQRDKPMAAHSGVEDVYPEKSSASIDDARLSAGIDVDENNDTVSILKIGYPALIEQMKARKCVELYLVYAERLLENPTENISNSHNNPNAHSDSRLLLLLTTAFMLLSST